MARKTFDELVEEYAAEEKAAQNETEPVETPEVEPSVEDNHTEPTPEPEPAPVNEEPKTEEPPKDEPKADPVIDEIENTNATIRKRLEKQAKSYEQKLADKDAEWQKKFEEFKSQFEQKKPEVKTRDNFEHDEEYVAYLTQQQIDKDRAEQQRIKAEQDEEAAKKKAEEDAAAAEVKSRQTRFLNNIEQCFDGEARDTFMARLKYAHSKGFGELLDANPAASDYLLSSPKGPLVLAKLLDTSNPEYFRRVFPVGGINPLEQFSELKDIERTAVAERNGTVEAPAALKKPATIGRPGAQGSGGTGGNPMSDPKARLDYVRKVMGY
jgi:hypothetical protein